MNEKLACFLACILIDCPVIQRHRCSASAYNMYAPAPWPLDRGTATGRPMEAQADLGSGEQVYIDARRFGAKGDNQTDCTASIVRALLVGQATPGAIVVLPSPGIYLSGPLVLNATRHLTLRIESGATLASLGIQLARQSRWPIVPGLYPANEPADQRGRTYAPILWLFNVHNIVLDGGGKIDGRGEDGWWQSAVRPPISRNATCPDVECQGCQGSCPKRPRLFLCQNSSFVTLNNLTFRHSPFWTTHFYNSTDIKVSRLNIDNPSGGPHGHAPYVSQYGYGPNADGIDVEHSSRVLIEHSHVHCGDDAICLKAGFAPSTLPPTSEVLARNNTIHTSCPHVPPANRNDGCGGMKIGYGTHSGIHNVLFEGNRVDFAGVAIKVSSHLGEGGTLRNLSFYNTVVRQTGIGINVDLGTYHPSTSHGSNISRLSTLDGLNIVNFTAPDSIGCLPTVTKGAYCGGAGCLIGNTYKPLGVVRLHNIIVSSRDEHALPSQNLGWVCDNTSTVATSGLVVPRACRLPPVSARFQCSET